MAMEESSSSPPNPHPAEVRLPSTPRGRAAPFVIAGGVAFLLVAGALLVLHAESQANTIAVAASPKPVTTVNAHATFYRPKHVYVGTLRPWIEANVGPQFVSAYVDTVLVRPGAIVKRNEVLATLDCRNASASNLQVEAEAHAIDAQQKAIADESARLNAMLDGGFVSPNEAEQKEALSASEQARLAAERAKLATTTLAVSDCLLRAPFDGEVSVRSIDPGAFVHPGASIVTMVDRSTVRMTFEVPESDFGAVAQKTPVSIHVLATGTILAGAVARRSPAADPDTRTVHVEVDLNNASHAIPVNATGQVEISVGDPKPAVEIPLVAASITDTKATLYLVDHGVARKKTFEVLGEEGAKLYLDKALPAGTRVVTEGRSLLSDGDPVAAKDAPEGGALSIRQPGANASDAVQASEANP